MATSPDSETPIQELKHDAVPGYPKGFAIAIAIAGLYLAIILISSPGKVDHGHKGYGDSNAEKHAKTATDETPNDAKKSKSH